MSLIGLLLPDVHVSNRNHTNEIAPHGERGKQAPADAGPAESVVPPFPLRVSGVAPDNQGFIEEHILCFFGRDVVPFPVLLDIAIIPVEPGTTRQRMSLSELSGIVLSALFGIRLLGRWRSRQQPGDGCRMDLEKPCGIGGCFVAFGNHLSDLRLLLWR